jgi:hypothetical protein
MEIPGMQQWHKGSVPQTAAMFKKRGDNQHDLQKGHQTRDCKASTENLKRVSENKEMDIVEGTAPSETEKEIMYEVRAGQCGITGHSMSYSPKQCCV